MDFEFARWLFLAISRGPKGGMSAELDQRFAWQILMARIIKIG
jgi:hypothetical protein